jgi:hypothetical protein
LVRLTNIFARKRSLWRRRLAGVFYVREYKKTCRRDAGATVQREN